MFYDGSFCAVKLFVNQIAMSNVNYFIKYDMNYRLIRVLPHLLGQDVDRTTAANLHDPSYWLNILAWFNDLNIWCAWLLMNISRK